MKKIISFGDSFVFGLELNHNLDGHRAWAGLAAKKLHVDYHTCAVSGCGNEHIARQILTWFENNPVEDTLAVINWTWMNRWDFYITEHETWITLGPTCVPQKLAHLVNQTQAQDMVAFYQQRANSSLIWNKFRNLQTLFAIQSYLSLRNITAIQTFMDTEMFDQQWHAPDYIKILQNLVRPKLELFEGLNFLDWSRKQGYAVTEPGWHPLEQAHQAASELWMSRYQQALSL